MAEALQSLGDLVATPTIQAFIDLVDQVVNLTEAELLARAALPRNIPTP